MRLYQILLQIPDSEGYLPILCSVMTFWWAGVVFKDKISLPIQEERTYQVTNQVYLDSNSHVRDMHSHVSVKISMSHCLCMHTLSLSLVYPCLTVCACTLSWYHAFTCQC